MALSQLSRVRLDPMPAIETPDAKSHARPSGVAEAGSGGRRVTRIPVRTVQRSEALPKAGEPVSHPAGDLVGDLALAGKVIRSRPSTENSVIRTCGGAVRGVVGIEGGVVSGV